MRQASPARQGNLAGSGQVQHAEALHQIHELLNFALIARDFDRESLWLDVDNLGAKNIRDLHHLGPRFGINRHFYQNQLAVHVLAVAEIGYFENIRQLIELLDDLFKGRVVTTRDDRHT